MAVATATSHTVEAYNVSHASENKIHDDSVAKKLGFSGGLVPGVEVFAYMTHLPLARWGRGFLERGTISARFGKPVYDGRLATVTAVETGTGLALSVASDGVACATGEAACPEVQAAAPALSGYPAALPPAAGNRPPADEESLGVGRTLATLPDVLTEARHAQYLRDVRETDPIYAREGIAHPGLLLRLCNSTLRENVVLAPWIHTGSVVRYFATARVGEALSARARVVANYDHRGHRLVDLDCLILADDRRPIAHVVHTAIYRLRHLAE